MKDYHSIVLIDCSIPINTRNQKIIDSIQKYYPDSEIHVITWNRDGRHIESSSFYHTYNRRAPYGDYLAKLLGMKGFRRFIKESLRSIHPSVIIASHWSNLILVSDYKKKNQKLIYDNLDIPTGGRIVRGISSLFENKALKNVDLIVHASRFFMPLYENEIPQIVLENKPMFSPCFNARKSEMPIKVSFIGSIRYKSVLMNLVEVLKNDDRFELFFHGGGEDLNAMKDYCKGINNVYFTGPYSYSSIVSLYHQSDIIWASYPSKDYNARFAISNKFHESLYVGVPCIFSKGTHLASFVQKENLGLVVNPYSFDDIKLLFEAIASRAIDLDSIKQSMYEYLKRESTWNQDFEKLLCYIKPNRQ